MDDGSGGGGREEVVQGRWRWEDAPKRRSARRRWCGGGDAQKWRARCRGGRWRMQHGGGECDGGIMSGAAWEG